MSAEGRIHHDSMSDLYAVGEVLYMHCEWINVPRVGDVFDLDNGQAVEVLTAKRSDGAHEARKLTVRVLGNRAQRRANRRGVNVEGTGC